MENGQPYPVDLTAGFFSGYFIVELNREKPYKISVSAENDLGLIPSAGSPVLARLQQGNALVLTEDQFDRFAAEYRDARINERASERARQVLAEAKAQGLKIAVENWPHEEAFPALENDQGLNVLLDQANLTMDMALMREALRDPQYKDVLDIQLAPAPGGTLPCYTESYSTSLPAPGEPIPITWNVMAQIHFNYSAGSYNEFFDRSMDFVISTRTWIYNRCFDRFELRYVDHPVTTDAYAQATFMVGYAATEPMPVVKLKASAKDDNIEVGVCETYDPTGPDGSACYAPRPRLISNTYTSTLTDEGFLVDGIQNQIEHHRLPNNTDGPNYQRWDVTAIFRPEDDDAQARPYGPFAFPILRAVRSRWVAHGHEPFFNFRACEYNTTKEAYFTDPVCGDMIIVFGRNASPSAMRRSSVPAHEGGHWVHTRIQGDTLPPSMSGHRPCVPSSQTAAWVEGFAEYFANKSGFVDPFYYTKVGQEVYSGCGTTGPDAYMDEGRVADFLWDVFDREYPGALDEDLDYYRLDVDRIYGWLNWSCANVKQFIAVGKYLGKPFYGSEDLVCDVQTLNKLNFDCP